MREEEGEVTFGLALFVFCASAIGDVVWVHWILRATQLRSIRAGNWGAAIMLIGSVGIHTIAQSYWYAIPAAAGAWLGSWGTVRFEEGKS